MGCNLATFKLSEQRIVLLHLLHLFALTLLAPLGSWQVHLRLFRCKGSGAAE